MSDKLSDRMSRNQYGAFLNILEIKELQALEKQLKELEGFANKLKELNKLLNKQP